MESLTEPAVHAAIKSVAGNLTYAAQLLGVTRQELLEFAARRPELRALVDDIRDAMIDDAQALVREAVAEQQPWAIKLVLRTQGRRRGYGDRVAPLRRDAGWKPPPEPEHILERLSPEQRARLEEIYAKFMKNQEPDTLDACEPDAQARESKAGCAPDAQPGPACQTESETPLPAHSPLPIRNPKSEIRNSEDVVRAAVVKFKGHLAKAAAEIGLTRGKLEEHIERRPILRALLVHFRDELIDHAETGLHMALGKKAQWAVELVLETIGRKQGFGKGYLPNEDPNWLQPPNPYDLSILTDAEVNELVHLHNIAQGIPEPTYVDEMP